MTTIFDIIADSTRRQILDRLRQRPHLVGELVEILDISQPGVSKQLRILRDVGLVHVKRDAQKRWYILQPEPLQELDAWLQDYRQLWSDRFDNLDDYLQQLDQEEQNTDEQ
ncbi:MAG: metalloregulator ArsR/SmtB family transcription factor [Phototrophicaceae bacterium]